jgi:RecA-family ATPase
VTFQTLADFEVRPVEWLWYGRLARGKVTLVDGDPGDNKSTMSLDLAARLTTGRPLPTFTRPEPVGSAPRWVAIMTAEDDPGDTVRPRFEAAGGDPSYAAWVPTFRTMWSDTQAAEVQVPTSIPDDLDVVRAIIEQTGAVLLIVDPLSAYIGSVDAHRDNEVRAALRPLADLAAELGFAVLAVRHFTKSGQGRALHRGGGSVAFIGAARVGMTVVRDPDDDTSRLLSVSKCNIAPEQATLRYRIASHPTLDQPMVEWIGTDDRKADDLVNAGDDDRNEAEAFVLSQLEAGPRPAADVLSAANAAGIPRSTLMAAKRRLKVESKRDGFGADGGWTWVPPPKESLRVQELDPGPYADPMALEVALAEPCKGCGQAAERTSSLGTPWCSRCWDAAADGGAA